jgi:integrase
MSVYSVQDRGWRVDFELNKKRHSSQWYKTKRKAKQAETDLRKELARAATSILTDMGFKTLVNLKLDHVASHNSTRYYTDFKYMAKRWCEQMPGPWGALDCSQIDREMIEHFVNKRKRVSAATANKEISFLRAVFNFGNRYDLGINPVNGIAFFPVDKKLRYVPTPSDVQLVILHARADDWLMKRYPDGADYLETLRDTLARMSEVNQLKWTDVDLAQKHLILFTRKIDGGLTPRKIPLTNRLYEILSRMKTEQGSGQASGPWVFPNPRTGKPYSDRKGIMRRLCKKAEIHPTSDFMRSVTLVHPLWTTPTYPWGRSRRFWATRTEAPRRFICTRAGKVLEKQSTL